MILFHDIKEKQTVWVLSETPILSILKENSIFYVDNTRNGSCATSMKEAVDTSNKKTKSIIHVKKIKSKTKNPDMSKWKLIKKYDIIEAKRIIKLQQI